MYKRVLIKLSGEAISGEGNILDYDKVDKIAEILHSIAQKGVQMGIVIGGGNIFRGRTSGSMNKTDADNMGMLATAINSIALKDALLRIGAKASVLSAIEMLPVCDTYTNRDAMRRLEQGEIVIFACGTGNPFFTTDTAAALRALQINADVLLCGKNIDGVYTADPNIDKNAIRFDNLTYKQVIEKNLKALDQTAFVLCQEGKMPIFVFSLEHAENLLKAMDGTIVGTHVRENFN